MGKSVRERLNRTIERDKREISEFNSKMTKSKELQLGMECSSAEVNLKNDNKITDNDEVDHDEVEDDIENIRSYFTNFASWMDAADRTEEYDFTSGSKRFGDICG